MKLKSLRYLTGEGFRNIRTNKLMSLASVAVLMSCLVLIGSAVLLSINVNVLLEKVESQNVIMVFIEDSATENDINELENSLKALENVDTCTYISKEEAYSSVIDELGDSAQVLSGVDSTFLPDSFEVTIKNMAEFSQTVASIKAMSGVMKVRENSDLAARLNSINRSVAIISIGLITVLFIVSLFIVANTVRITMFSRKLEISIMKAVGATNGFIRWPFLIEGINLGIISAVLSVGVLYVIYTLSGSAMQDIFGILGGSPVPFSDYVFYIAAAFFVTSVLTGGFGSIISIGKYLKEQGSVVLDE